MKSFALVLLLAAVCSADPVRVLFVGNSFTYVNDLPDLFAQVATSLGQTVYVNRSVIGGCTLYAQTPSRDSVTAALLQQEWDFVVLQDFSQLPTVKKARQVYMYPAIQEFLKYTGKAKVIMYNTWGYFNGTTSACPDSDTASCFPLGTLAQMTSPNCALSSSYHNKVDTFECMSYAVARGYMSTFSNTGIDYMAPCGMAWMVARGAHPVPADCQAAVDAEYPSPLEHNITLPLNVPFHSDTSGVMLYLDNGGDKHPTVAGQYLNAMVFYAVIFRSTPRGAVVPPGAQLTQSQVLGLQEVAGSVVLDYSAAWGMPQVRN